MLSDVMLADVMQKRLSNVFVYFHLPFFPLSENMPELVWWRMKDMWNRTKLSKFSAKDFLYKLSYVNETIQGH